MKEIDEKTKVIKYNILTGAGYIGIAMLIFFINPLSPSGSFKEQLGWGVLEGLSMFLLIFGLYIYGTTIIFAILEKDEEVD
jgi:hypothetical protein